MRGATGEKTMKIEGMMCPHCETTVKKTLEAIDGVESAEVSHEKGSAVLTMSIASRVFFTVASQCGHIIPSIFFVFSMVLFSFLFLCFIFLSCFEL